ncbi:hypothetical protein [Gimesia fumaroli]|uniref:Uncharacterized protein n=1 Tax=Gimesia fumaroli TaxID=2527976 RepID=A0A518I6I2_9PLAN|nr:hypothetical protein [Gimesia fumaroli]QDV48683.1 hypothetical protein Enr17x_06960 [Gimesia fumaroli]
MGQILSACEREVTTRDLEEVRAPGFKFDKREAFLRETKKFPCLRRIPELNKLADTIVASWYLEPATISSRKWHRIPLERSIGLAMVNSKTRKLESDIEVVEGRNLSIEGISFSHHSPIYSREVAVTFDLKKSVKEFLVVRLAWSRFSENQTFQSGGKFLYQTKLKVG